MEETRLRRKSKKLKNIIEDIKEIKELFEDDMPEGIRQAKQAHPEVTNRIIAKIFGITDQYVGQVLSGKKGVKSQTGKRNQGTRMKQSEDGTISITAPINLEPRFVVWYNSLVRDGYTGTLSDFVNRMMESALLPPPDPEVQRLKQEKEKMMLQQEIETLKRKSLDGQLEKFVSEAELCCILQAIEKRLNLRL